MTFYVDFICHELPHFSWPFIGTVFEKAVGWTYLDKSWYILCRL